MPNKSVDNLEFLITSALNLYHLFSYPSKLNDKN